MISRFLAPILLFSMVITLSCSSPDERSDNGGRSDLPSEGPEPGELEEQMRQYVIDMTVLLQTYQEDPHQQVTAVGGYLQENQDAIRENARLLRERIMAMDWRERMYYEERYAEFFHETTRAWHQAVEDFRARSPEEAQVIEGLMVRFD